ncbi:myoD family inhibitor domain-containing protein isoform X2 [Narcine bancroftii]|uniref:myoD family inhibitor domain-containing protein isoform X2 n=1 Tax=Narcine bancroftii TaxID=1343680 RepID=UPI0038316EAD
MSQGNNKGCSYTQQGPAAPAGQGARPSRDRDNESDNTEDRVLLREDTAPFEEQEVENKIGGYSSPLDTVTCQPQATPSTSSFTPGNAARRSASSQSAIRQDAPRNNTITEAANRFQSPVAFTLIEPRVPSGGVAYSTPSTSHGKHGELQSYPSINSHSSKKSKSSSKSTASQIPSDAEEDCCVHCILACLFCQFLTLCNIVLDCATCGSCTSDTSCCFCCGSEECAACDLPCDPDCGIVDACCESADCLEICMECCGLCFSS